MSEIKGLADAIERRPMTPRTAAGRALLADWDPEEPGMAKRILAIEAEAAAQVTEYATGLSDDLGREIAANAALESALRALVTAQERYDSGHGDQEAAWLAVSDALFAARAALAATDVRGALVHDWLQPGMDGWQHRGTDDWQCACGAWGSHLWMGWAYHLQAALAAKGVEG